MSQRTVSNGNDFPPDFFVCLRKNNKVGRPDCFFLNALLGLSVRSSNVAAGMGNRIFRFFPFSRFFPDFTRFFPIFLGFFPDFTLKIKNLRRILNRVFPVSPGFFLSLIRCFPVSSGFFLSFIRLFP